jgi:hypothetical protein
LHDFLLQVLPGIVLQLLDKFGTKKIKILAVHSQLSHASVVGPVYRLSIINKNHNDGTNFISGYQVIQRGNHVTQLRVHVFVTIRNIGNRQRAILFVIVRQVNRIRNLVAQRFAIDQNIADKFAFGTWGCARVLVSSFQFGMRNSELGLPPPTPDHCCNLLAGSIIQFEYHQQEFYNQAGRLGNLLFKYQISVLAIFRPLLGNSFT